MNQKWTLHVENFARIKEADIEISPLMCFIGDNNSGKSYMMSLLWGIIANGHMFYNSLQRCMETTSYKDCERWMLSNIGKTISITDDIEKKYVAWFNEILKVHKTKLLKKIFNYEIESDKIEIINFVRHKKITVTIKDRKSEHAFGYEPIDEDSFIIGIIPDETEVLFISNFLICWHLLMFDLTRITSSLIREEMPIYLPASRTGFLLTYKQIASKSIGFKYSLPDEENYYDDNQENLTAPYIQFLDFLIKLQNSTDKQKEKKNVLINFLNDEIFHGTIGVKNKGRSIRYFPEDMIGVELPLNITSSVITETVSFLLILKTNIPIRLVIIEEPEAHLHPALQKKIAQLLIRFVHSGAPIWITTHSDTILQHFNNMIKLNNRPEQERDELLKQFNYTKEDLLSPDEIHLYQFTREDTHTTIKSLESGKYGFIVPSFNKAIDELSKEIFAFQEDD